MKYIVFSFLLHFSRLACAEGRNAYGTLIGFLG